jgi:hypothetical protein
MLEAQLERDDARNALQVAQSSMSAMSAQVAELEARLVQACEERVDAEANAAALVGVCSTLPASHHVLGVVLICTLEVASLFAHQWVSAKALFGLLRVAVWADVIGVVMLHTGRHPAFG